MTDGGGTGQAVFATGSRLSVVLPTYRRPQSLRRALESLRAQTFENFEILVVDNLGDPLSMRIANEVSETIRVPLRYLIETELGLHNARHRGAREARGDVLVFTDDDATFDSGWLQAFARAFAAHPEMAAAGAPVDPVWEDPPPRWLLEYMGNTGTFPPLSLMQQNSEFTLDADGVFFGVNMAIRRVVLFEMGGFNPESFGDTWLGDGEIGLARKLWERGMLVGYVPEALVHHHIPRSRITRNYLSRRMANEGACTEYAHFHRGMPRYGRLSLRIGRIFLSVGRLWLATLVRLIARHDRSALLNLRLGMIYSFARARYVLRLFYDKQLRELVVKEDWLGTGDSV